LRFTSYYVIIQTNTTLTDLNLWHAGIDDDTASSFLATAIKVGPQRELGLFWIVVSDSLIIIPIHSEWLSSKKIELGDE
jgi:hypothetical protein